MRASDTSEVIFDDCRCRRASCSARKGRASCNTLQVLDAGRIGIAALSVGLAQGAYEAARDYARERRQFGQPIAAFQAIQWKLADNATRIEAARLLTYRAAYLKDVGVRTTRESSMAKLFASEMAVKAADDCVQIHGGYGFVKDYPGREVLPRRQAPHHRRRHERDPAPGDRPAAAGAVTEDRSRQPPRRDARRPRARRRSAGHRPRHLADRRRSAGRRRAAPRRFSRRPAAPFISASPDRPAPARARSSIA